MSDCSKVLEYAEERRRMCKECGCDCSKCAFDKYYCKDVVLLSQENIDALQKWSDEHPETTRQDKFLELFPNARGVGSVIDIRPCDIDNRQYNSGKCGDGMISHKCYACKEAYWKEIVE